MDAVEKGVFEMPLHPAIVHFPIVLAALSPFVLGWLVYRAWRGTATRRAWALAVGLQVALVGSGLLALRTGEADEDRAEATVAESVIEAHEEKATTFVIGAGAVLGLVVIGFALPRASRVLAPAGLVATLAIGGLGLLTGRAGGEIVYGPQAPAGTTVAHDDDD